LIDDLGLLAAIEWQAHEFQARTGIVCILIQKVDSLNLEEQQATAAFRIFQEILTNVARHAKASEVASRTENRRTKSYSTGQRQWQRN
jgi:signal transduction histidine kinase